MAVKAKKVNEIQDGIADKDSLEVFTDKNGKMFKRSALGRQDYSFETDDIKLPIPRQCPSIVHVDGNLAGIGHDLPVSAVLSYSDESGNYFKIPIQIELQGASSLGYPKKNYSIDLLTQNGDDEYKIKFGHWAAMDGFHLKANWTDATHAVNICTARLIEQAYQTRPVSQRYPWSKSPEEGGTSLKDYRSTGAMGHIDGFAIELYLNGSFNGLYTWNIGKKKENYLQDKDNPLEIHMESNTSPLDSTYNPAWWSIRNPKTVTPDVLASINRFFNWKASVHGNSAAFGEQWQGYISQPFALDYYLFLWMLRIEDIPSKNVHIVTYDGLLWYMQLYDLDSGMGGSWNGKTLWPPDDGVAYDDHWMTGKAWFWRDMFPSWLPALKQRYAELRSTVLHPDNVEKVLVDFTNTIPYDLYKRDAAKWPTIPSNTTVHYSVQYFADWYRARVALMDPQMDYTSGSQALLL